MRYWIEDNGKKIGPMRAVDVLRRAQPPIRVFDGETWFYLDEASIVPPRSEETGISQSPSRVALRTSES